MTRQPVGCADLGKLSLRCSDAVLVTVFTSDAQDLSTIVDVQTRVGGIRLEGQFFVYVLAGLDNVLL